MSRYQRRRRPSRAAGQERLFHVPDFWKGTMNYASLWSVSYPLLIMRGVSVLHRIDEQGRTRSGAIRALFYFLKNGSKKLGSNSKFSQNFRGIPQERRKMTG